MFSALMVLALGAASAAPPIRPPAGVDCGVDHPLVRGWCVHGRAPARALDAWASVDDPVLSPWARWQRAELRIDDDPEGALADLDLVTLPGSYGLRVRLLRGRARVELGRSLEAREDLRDLLDTDVGVEARWWLAVGGRDRGDTAAAIATFRRVWIDALEGDLHERTAAALADLDADPRDLTDPVDRDLARARVRVLRDARQHDEALIWVRRLEEAEGTSWPGADLGHLLFRARRYDEAVATWADALGAPGAANGSPLDLFRYALATSRTGDYATAAVIYGRLLARHPTSRQADDARYKLGYLPYDAGRCDDAIAAWTEQFSGRARSRNRLAVWWFSGWCLWRRGDRDASAAWWDRLVADGGDRDLVAGVAYWRARAEEEAGDPTAMRAVVADHPGTAYAWFAARRLGVRHAPQPVVRPRPPRADPHAEAARRLDALGFESWAEAHWLALADGTRGAEGRLAVAHALAETGQAAAARRLVAASCRGRRDDASYIAVCHPRPAADVVTPRARDLGLPPSLPYAVMWTESALDPSVTSAAGARGLMQIMPAEVARLHAAADLPGKPSANRLYQSTYNAALGVTELGEKARSLTGLLAPTDLPAVIASYNAGEGPVRRWIAAHPEGPVPADRFMEDIGYSETRRYVRRVLAHLDTYERLYGSPEAPDPAP